VMGMKAAPGTFYTKSPTEDFQGMSRLMKDYVRRRSAWVDRTLLGSQAPPKSPEIKVPTGEKSVIHSLKGDQPLVVSLESGADAKSVQWHLGDATRGSKETGTSRRPSALEIVPVWKTNGVDKVEIPREVLKAGRMYRLRARVMDAEGNASHYSKPFEFSTTD
jgi:hypothetical protein